MSDILKFLRDEDQITEEIYQTVTHFFENTKVQGHSEPVVKQLTYQERE